MRIVFVATVLSEGLAACVASGAADPPPLAPADQKIDSVQSYCQARAQAECSETVVSKCGVSDVKSCIAARAPSCVRTAPQGTDIVGANASACLRLVTDAYADGVLTSDELAKIDKACGPALFSGPGAARSPCTGPYDCRSIDGLTCLIPAFQTQGKCMKLQAVAANAPCPGEADQCPDDYYCEPRAKLCQAEADVGEQCDAIYHPCRGGMACPTNPFAGGRCQAKWDTGHACRADADCATKICSRVPGSADGNCNDAITLSPLDGACAVFKPPVTTAQ
jgi:hypothetical protein